MVGLLTGPDTTEEEDIDEEEDAGTTQPNTIPTVGQRVSIEVS